MEFRGCDSFVCSNSIVPLNQWIVKSAMLDAHVHIERGPYTREWLDNFVRYAQERGIQELWFLEHSFRFREFHKIYGSIEVHPRCGTAQKEWLRKACCLSIAEYQRLADKQRRASYPISVKFGLEVCYFPEKESEIEKLLSDFDWDFVSGSIHWIDGWGFDRKETEEEWLSSDIDKIYRRYYQLMLRLVDSGLFTNLAHPDSIKCFGYHSGESLIHLYDQLAKLLKKNGVSTEISCGLKLNYGCEEIGPNKALLNILRSNGVRMVTASDSHRPEDTGRYVGEANQILNQLE